MLGSSIERITVTSEALRGNLVGAALERTVDVYLPAGGRRDLPLLVDLVGFSGSGLSHTNWRAFGEHVPARLDRLIAAGAMPPVVVAFPDCFTRLGGNQYIDSVAVGRWEHFLCAEMVPALEARFGCGEVPIFVAHCMGGCIMGTDPARSVVDSRTLRHHALDDVFVIDGSVFPTACSVNPQISIYGLASWGAEHVREAVG